MKPNDRQGILDSSDDHQPHFADGPSDTFRMERVTSTPACLDDSRVTSFRQPLGPSFVLPFLEVSNLAALPSGAIVLVPMTAEAYAADFTWSLDARRFWFMQLGGGMVVLVDIRYGESHNTALVAW